MATTTTGPTVADTQHVGDDNDMQMMDDDNDNYAPITGDEEDEDGMMTMDDGDMLQAFLDDGTDPFGDPALGAATRQVSDSTTETTTTTTNNKNYVNNTVCTVASNEVSHTPDPLVLTGRPAIPLYLSCNPDYLSEYQCLIRKHVELFEATEQDLASRIKGRNKPIVLGQVGIRCCHCRHVPIPQRERGSMYYPHTLVGVYQASQILSQQHLLETCPFVPPKIREELSELKTKKSYATAGKEYWAATAQVLGVYQDQYGLRFEKRLGLVRHLEPH